jgi:hypothetical protein
MYNKSLDLIAKNNIMIADKKQVDFEIKKKNIEI